MIVPRLPSQHFKTYEIIAPLPTHWRPATCEEVDCEAWRNGWNTIVPAGSPQDQYIRSGSSGRRFHELTGMGDLAGGMVHFQFPAGQPCFASGRHRLALEREPIYVARGGDWRGNPLGERRVHARAQDWVEDFSEHQDRIKKSREG